MSDLPASYGEQRYTQAIHRYTSALERGDIETVADVLRDAEQDQHLEQLLLDANILYKRKNFITVSHNEVEQAQAMLLDTFPSYESEEPQDDPDMYSSEKLPVPANSHIHIQKDRMKSMQTQETTLSKFRKQPAPAKRPRLHRISGYIQTLAAVLVVAILISGFALLFASRHNTTTGSGTLGSGHATLSHTILIAGTNDGTIYATRPDTGAVAWHYATGKSVTGGISSALVVQGEIIYFVDNGQLYALHATNGTLLWHKNLDVPGAEQNSYTKIIVDRGIVFVGGTVYGVGLPLGNMYALRERDGAILWQYRSDGNPLLAAHNGVVYVAKAADKQGRGAIQALQGSDGNSLWSYTTEPIEVVAANDTTYVYSAHVQVKGDMGGNKEYKSLLAINSKGTLLWSKSVSDNGVSPLVITHEVVILGGIDKNIYRACAYRTANGFQAWCTSNQVAPDAGNVTSGTITNDSVYYSYPTSFSNALLVVGYNVNDGSSRWFAHFTEGVSFGLIVSMNKMVYALTDHKAYALDAANGHVHWQLSNSASTFTSLAVGSW